MAGNVKSHGSKARSVTSKQPASPVIRSAKNVPNAAIMSNALLVHPGRNSSPSRSKRRKPVQITHAKAPQKKASRPHPPLQMNVVVGVVVAAEAVLIANHATAQTPDTKMLLQKIP
jgi:hypothetical protein